MSATEHPSWLVEALADRANVSAPTASIATGIEPGQIRRLDPMDFGAVDTRLVLVTATDDQLAVATVMVLSPELDMGTDIDQLVSKSASGLPYDLIALTDVAGPAWFVQLGPVLGHADTDLSDQPPAGIALRDELDARWSWKEDELDAFVALTAECRCQLLDGETATVADPAAFDLELVGDAERTCITLKTVRMLAKHQVLLPAEALDYPVVQQTSRAYESFIALWQAIPRHPEQVLPRTSTHTAEVPSLRAVENDPLPRILAFVAERLDHSIRCIRVATVSSLWAEPTDHAHFRAVLLAGKRHQLVVSEVDVPEVHIA